MLVSPSVVAERLFLKYFRKCIAFVAGHPWIVFGVIVLTGALVGVYLLFKTYYEYVGPNISHKPEAWSSFGSLLSGVFTLFGAAATIATLIFLGRQFKEQQEITRKQIESLTFEQYLSHRGLFFTRLAEIEKLFFGYIRFANPDKLYGIFFPRNNPTFCELKVGVDCSSVEFKSISKSFERLPELFAGSLKKYEVLDIVGRVGGISHSLQIEYFYEPDDGDVMFSGEHTGLNIYSLDVGVLRLYEVYNNLLFFSGCSAVQPIEWLNCDEEIRFWFLKFYSRASARMEPYVTFNDPDLYSIHKAYVLVQEIQRLGVGLNVPIHLRWQLDSMFSTAKSVKRVEDKVMLNSLVDEAIKEVELLLAESFKCLVVTEVLEELYERLKFVDLDLFERKLKGVRYD